jgi:hypothetical protein
VTPSLSILCITQAEAYADRFIEEMIQLAEELPRCEFILLADRVPAGSWLEGLPVTPVPVASRGYLESVLNLGVAACSGDYVLRLDDDEMCSMAMRKWLIRGAYVSADHWKFPRLHLWKDEGHCLRTPQLWPDHQTRLSAKVKAGGRPGIHDGSPHGGGEDAGVVIEHHKFLVKSYEDRRAIALRYESIHRGTGLDGMTAFNLPEDVYDTLTLQGEAR